MTKDFNWWWRFLIPVAIGISVVYSVAYWNAFQIDIFAYLNFGQIIVSSIKILIFTTAVVIASQFIFLLVGNSVSSALVGKLIVKQGGDFMGALRFSTQLP
jgi:hypothetical protein